MIPSIFNNNKLKKTISDLSSICSIIWEKGWAESNAGNISVDISSNIEIKDYSSFVKSKYNKEYKKLTNRTLLITASGSRFRDISKYPLEHLGLLKFTEGKKYILKDFIPTSELETHLLIHNSKKNQVVLHAHPNEVIAMSILNKFKSNFSYKEIFSSILTDVETIINEGIAIIPFYPPGSVDLVRATAEKLKENNLLIWERHGVVSIAENLNYAFDNVDILNKAAKLYLLTR